MRSAAEIVAAARACVGTKFRAQGRMPGVGLDCVGVVAVATEIEVPSDYTLRSAAGRRVEEELRRSGFRTADAVLPGDVIVIEPAVGMRHLGVVSGPKSIVHAHSGLRRVVEGPVAPEWRVVGVWRLAGEG